MNIFNQLPCPALITTGDGTVLAANIPLLTLLEKNQDDDFIISLFNLDTLEYDKVLESAVLDVFDFDLSWVLSEMKKVDWSVELTNPLEEYSFIKKRNKELIIF